MNNRSIPSTHTERKITDLSVKHSFTLYPYLSPYSQTELQRDKYTRYTWAGWTFFPVVLLCQFLVLVGTRFWFYILLMYLVTFVNQVMLCCAFVLFSPENYSHKSGAIFHIDLYAFYIHTEIPNGTNKLNHVKRSAVFQNKPFLQSHTAEWIIVAITGISVCSPLFKTPFTAAVLNGFLLSMKGLSSTTRLLFSSFFSDLVWQTMLPNPTASFH